MGEIRKNTKVAGTRERTFEYYTLGEAVRMLLCDVQRYRFASGDRCKCEDPWPRTYYCVYGDCEIVRCERCHRIINWKGSKCRFPYQKGENP